MCRLNSRLTREGVIKAKQFHSGATGLQFLQHYRLFPNTLLCLREDRLGFVRSDHYDTALIGDDQVVRRDGNASAYGDLADMAAAGFAGPTKSSSAGKNWKSQTSDGAEVADRSFHDQSRDSPGHG